MKHLLSLKDYSSAEIEEILDLAAQVKADPRVDLWDCGLLTMAEILTLAPADRPREVLSYLGGFWFPGEE